MANITASMVDEINEWVRDWIHPDDLLELAKEHEDCNTLHYLAFATQWNDGDVVDKTVIIANNTVEITLDPDYVIFQRSPFTGEKLQLGANVQLRVIEKEEKGA